MAKTPNLGLELPGARFSLNHYNANQKIIDDMVKRRTGINPNFAKRIEGNAFISGNDNAEPVKSSANMTIWGKTIVAEAQFQLLKAQTKTPTNTINLGSLNSNFRPGEAVIWRGFAGSRNTTPPWAIGSGYIGTTGDIILTDILYPGAMPAAGITLPVGTKFVVPFTYELVR